MKATLRMPGVSPVVSDVVTHFVAVFLLAFGTQMVTAATGKISISSLLAILISAAAAGVVAVAHIILGLIPTPAVGDGRSNAFGVPLKVKSAVYQIVTSVVVMFVSLFGAELIAGATHITSLPTATAVIVAAIMAAVAGVVQYVVKLVPAPSA